MRNLHVRQGMILGILSGLAILILGGCGATGDTGATGPAGASGPPGPVVRSAATSLTITVTDAKIGEPTTVDFKVTDQNGIGYAGIPQSSFEFIIAKLVPGSNGDPDEWQNYINKSVKPNGIGPGTKDTIQPQTDAGGTLKDNGDGTYEYAFGTDIENVTQPVAVKFDAGLVHRVAINIRSSTLPQANNGIYTWIPATGATTGFDADDVVDTASCNECHDRLAVHGGPRQDVKECVLCHNSGNTDPSSGNSLDFLVMIHKIHDGANLPSVVAGTPYVIYGYHDSVNDFSDVVFPQNIKNCTKCHAPNDANAPNSGDYASEPSMQACGSCHDNVDFAQGAAGGHPGGVVTDNTQCTVCHAANRVAGSVDDAHVIPSKLAAAQFQYNILSITNTAPGSAPVIKFSITNPENNDKPYDIATDPAFTAGGGATSVKIDLAWNTTDYSNDGSGKYPGQPISFNALTATANGDGTYTITSPTAIPLTATGSGEVAIEGHPAGDYTTPGTYADKVPVTSVTKYFAITDASPVPRRDDLDVAKCQKCHGENDGLSLHGGNRTDNVNLCVICHNPNDTDVSQRPADPDMTVNGINTAAVDGLEQRQIDFKYMIHAIHGAAVRSNAFVVYGYGGSVNDFSDVKFPGILADCTQCHTSNGYTLPLPAGVLGTTINTGATSAGGGTFYGSLTDSTTYLRITPTASACSACHDDSLAKAHMQQNGASFSITQALINSGSTTETCALCHGPGAVEDVLAVHQVGAGGGN